MQQPVQVELELVLLWIIREFQPISVVEIAERVTSGSIVIPTTDPRYHDYFNGVFGRGGSQALKTLREAGLVGTLDDPHAPNAPQWITLPALALVQDIFDLSLTQRLRPEPSGLSVFPIFGAPAPPAHPRQFAQVFMAMPFRDDLKAVYTDHVRPVAARLGLSCNRADDIFSASSIMGDVWSAIYHADACIVDCTGRNPNVFYELGIAHTLGRITIPIAQSIDDIPSDLRHLRFIVYQYTPPGMQQFEAALTKTLQSELELSSNG